LTNFLRREGVWSLEIKNNFAVLIKKGKKEIVKLDKSFSRKKSAVKYIRELKKTLEI